MNELMIQPAGLTVVLLTYLIHSTGWILLAALVSAARPSRITRAILWKASFVVPIVTTFAATTLNNKETIP